MFTKINFNRFIYIACSGGLDSCVMLDLMYKNFVENFYYKLVVIYIKHETKNVTNYFWEDYCKNLCFVFKLPLIIVSSSTTFVKQYKKTEGFYRNLRFFAFEILLYNVYSTICVGQHCNDHIETVLYRLFRGTGLSGLLGISMKIFLYGMFVVRPLLKMCKKEILNYALKNKIYWLNDFSNFSSVYYRNYIRNFLISNIELSLVAVRRLTVYVKQNTIFLNVFFTFILYKYCCKKSCIYKLRLEILFKFSIFLKTELIRVWFKENGLQTPKQIDILRIYSGIIYTKLYYTYVKLDFCFLVRYGKNIFLFKNYNFVLN